MKKYIFSIIAACFGLLSTHAENISVPDMNLAIGETATVGISLNNTATNLVSFQMDLTLPEGITVNKAGCSLSSRFTDEDQELTIGKQGTNVYRLMRTSFSLTPISDTNGEIITLSLSASADATGGMATLSNIRFVTSNSEKVTLENTSFSITVSTPSPIITFADAAVKALCVQNWDTNGDGELSEAEAAAVTSLGQVFKDNTEITSFDELHYFTGLTSIGERAFYNCSGLTSITIPNSVTSIRNYAFYQSGLESATIPATVVEICLRAFSHCYNLTEVEFRNGSALTTIGESAFDDSRNLKSIDIPVGVNSISKLAFWGCSGLTSITIPNSVTSIGESAFSSCSGLASITIPNSVTSIGYGAFWGCSGLASITIPDEVTSITSGAFYGCSSLTSINIPDGVTSIGGWTFNGCSSLTSIAIPNSVTSIGSEAFKLCSGLTSITIPNSVTSIGKSAFYGCSSLTSVVVKNPTPVAISQDVFSNRANATLYVPTGCKPAYETAAYWGEFGEIIAPVADLSELSNTKLYTLSDAGGALRVMGNTLFSFNGILDPDYMGLVSNVSQLSSPFTCSWEGSLAALLDNNSETYWHSIYYQDGSVVPVHSHYLQVELAESVSENIYLQVTRRQTENDHITQWGVYGSNNATAADGDWVELATIDMPYGNRRETLLSAPFDTKGYKYLRFYIDNTTGEEGVTRGFGHLSEFRLFMASDLAAYPGPANDAYCQFALLNINDKYYLYSPAARAFWMAQGGFCPGFGSAITLSADGASGDYRWTLSMPLNGQTVSLYDAPLKIMPVADFDPSEALAAFAENVNWGLVDGYYRIRSAGQYTNTVTDDTGQESEVRVYKYMRNSVDGSGDYYGSWGTPEDLTSDLASLWKLTNRDGLFDLQNMYSQGRFTTVSGDARAMMSETSESLMAFDRVTEVNGQKILNIRVASQNIADHYYLHMRGHSGGSGVSGDIVGWLNSGSSGPSEWVLEPVSDEEATAITSIAVGNTFAAAVPCGEGTADLTFKVTNCYPWEVEVSASPEDIAGALTIPATVQNESGIEFAVTGVGCEAFIGRHNLTAVSLPQGVIVIKDRAFDGCENLVSVMLPSTLRNIYSGAFWNCVALSSITLPDGLTKISLATFQNTPSLKSINLPEGIITIEHDAFLSSGLESIKFPSTLTSVGHEAFSDCKSLTSIDFNRCSANFEYKSFYACSSLEELFIPNTVKFLNNDGTWAWSNFGHCSSLRSVVFEAFEAGQQRWSTTTVFADCHALETVVLPSTSVMQNSFFAHCDNLRSVTFLEISDDFTPRTYNFGKMFQLLDPNKIHFTVPEGHAEELLKAGYINISDLSALPMARAEFEAQASRITTMMNALSDGDKATLTAAISSARSAANTAEDYATVYAQIDAIKAAAKTFLTTATLPVDFDVTAAAVINPDFEQLQLGWNVQNDWVNYPNVNKRGWNGATYENGDVSIDKFIDSWENTTLQDGDISQTITSLPAGIYRLEADILATNQNDANADVTGVSLFAAGQKTAVATENEKPQHFSVKFENTLTKDVTIGININGTNANWVAMDNVRFFYEGEATDIPQGIDLASDENARVYLYNVETGKYLSAGHSWGTHAMLDETGLPVRLTQDAETGLWQVYFWEGSKSDSDQLLFSIYSNFPEEEVCVDYNHGYPYADEDLTLWRITQTGDGSYLIQNKKYLDTEFYLGNIPTRQDYQHEYNGVSYTDIISKASVNDNSHWLIFTKENSDQLSAKHRLMAAIMRMEASDNVNDELLAAARAIYYNVDATAAEVIGITTQLNSQMGMPAENQPVDMTALIINPRFENNTTEGWSGANVVGGRADATSNHEQEFFQKDFNMYQTITGVPNGIYRLKWKGFHRPGSCDQVYNEFNAGTNNASAVVYANNTQKTMLNWATGAGDADLGDWQANGVSYPNSMEVARKYFDAGLYADFLEVEVTDNVLTIGVKNTEPMTGAHWVVFSDFELYIMENAEQAHNKFTLSDRSAVPGGSTVLPIVLKNTEEIVSFTAEVRLPAGVTPKTDANGNIIVKKNSRVPMTIQGNVTPEGICRFAALTNGQSIQGNDGEVFSFTILPAGEMELGEYEMQVCNIKLVNDQLLRIQPFNYAATLTLREASSGDVNGDGEVDVLDATMIVYYLLGRAPSINLEAADVNGDGDVDILDATIIVYRFLGRETGPAAVRQQILLEAE